MPPRSEMSDIENREETAPLFSYHNDRNSDKNKETVVAPLPSKKVGCHLILGLFLVGLVCGYSIDNMIRGKPPPPPLDGDDDHVYSSPARAPSRYKKFQALGFQVYTMGAPAFDNYDVKTYKQNKTELKHNSECEHYRTYGYADEEGIFCYLGLDDVNEDIARRLEVMARAVETAYEEADKDPTTLKVFNAPEFFFRGKDGTYDVKETDEMGGPEYFFRRPDGTYEVHEPEDRKVSKKNPREGYCGPICQILTGLEAIVEQEKFKDWLFLFGSVIAGEKLPSDDEFEYLFYNFAPLYKGGKPSSTQPRSGKRFLIPKRVMSNMDFLTPLRHLDKSIYKELFDDDSPVIAHASDSVVFNPFEAEHINYDNAMWSKYRGELNSLGYTMIDYSWFIMDEITFSVEICVDHDQLIGLFSYLANQAAGPARTLIPSGGDDEEGVKYVPFPRNMAQISLISSAGMNANANSLLLTDGGTLILQDGESNIKARQFYGNIYEEVYHMNQFEGGSEVIRRFPVITPSDVYFEYEIGRTRVEKPIYETKEELEKGFDQIFSTKKHPPTIAVYNPLRIPEVF